ncbi:precorrin-3B synthase [Rhizobium sp. Root482]|uniref:precorrin-3B synthase n=1 Tax=Rhizobium sp. Root482 TaxID=1736543 RepID=UPI0006FF1034|nr:precorrin-3B synthase [Rhizobium sp. Root482]KQY11403.1 precorrin-3B synthase [Rhizobium sp. Root482]
MTICAAAGEGKAGPRLSMRRGACPSLSAPMATGDGLLVRLRPANPGLTLRELAEIADGAEFYGNGILEITARGNLQIRGLTAETVPLLSAKIRETGIEIAEGLAVEVPPLAGLDPLEIADPQPLATRLRAASAARHPPLVLAPKLSITVDGGGSLHLGEITADIRLRAVAGGKEPAWLLSLAGTEHTAARIAVLGEPAVVPVVLGLLERLATMGEGARGRDIDAGALKDQLGSAADADDIAPLASASSPCGIHRIGADRVVLGVGLAFGQIRAGNLKAFIKALANLGATDIRLSPGHGMMVLGLHPEKIAAAQALAVGHGLRVFPDDPRNHIAACAGIGACGSAGIDTRAVAQMMVERAPALLDGSLTVHVSGCAKGCARPGASPLTITAAPIGYGLVVNGAASAAPNAYIEENTMEAALERLDALVRRRKRAGESARSCLTRLGAEVAAAVQRE